MLMMLASWGHLGQNNSSMGPEPFMEFRKRMHQNICIEGAPEVPILGARVFTLQYY